MATGGETQSLDADIDCTLCFNFLSEPWSLTCCHTFCEDCVQRLDRVREDNGDTFGVLCPMCREFCPEQNIRANFAMKNLIKAYAKRVNITEGSSLGNICMQCNISDVISYCSDCQINLCKKCKYTHRKHRQLPAFKEDNVIPMEKGRNMNPVMINQCCKLHPNQEVKLCCKPCNEVLCYECKAENHDTHATEPMKSALDRLLREVKDNIRTIKQKRESTKHTLQQIEQTKQEQEIHKERIKQEIQQEKKRKIKQIKLDAQQLLEVIDEHGSLRLKELEIWESDLEHKLSSQNSVVSWAETVTTSVEGPGLLAELLHGLIQSLQNYANEEEIDTRKITTGNTPEFTFRVKETRQKGNLVGDILREELLTSRSRRQHIREETPSNPVTSPPLGTYTQKHLKQSSGTSIGIAKPPATTLATQSAPMVKNKQPEQEAAVVKHHRSLAFSVTQASSFRRTNIILESLNDKSFKEKRKFKLISNVHRICCHNGTLLALNMHHHYIDTYDVTTCKSIYSNLRTITENHTIHELHTLNSEQLIAATEEGLIVFNNNGLFTSIREGCFIAVHVWGSVIASLSVTGSGDNERRILMLIDASDTSDNINQFEVDRYAKFVLLQESQVVIQSFSDCSPVITKYTLQGDVIGTFGKHGGSSNSDPGYLNFPRLCMIDMLGSVVVADNWNHRLQVLNKQGEWKVIKHDINFPEDVVMMEDGFLYVLFRQHDCQELLRFSCK